MSSDSPVRKKKAIYMKKLRDLAQEYSKILIIEADNVGSHQISKIRMQLRGRAVILFGKNTLMRKGINDGSDEKLKKLVPKLIGNIGLVFTNENLKDIKELIVSMRQPAEAKQGAVSPVKVIVPKGGTGMAPDKTSFFQALNISTKITRGSVEIISDFPLLDIGDRVGSSEATLLKMLNIKPFSYGLKALTVYDDGAIYDAKVLDMTDEILAQKFHAAASRVASIGLATGVPNEASVPHSLAASFKNLLSVACATEVTFPQAQSVKDFLADPSKFATATPVAEKSEEAQEEEEDEESESEGGMGGLFGDDSEED